MSAIDINGLNFSYGKSPVLTDVNLSIDENDDTKQIAAIQKLLSEGKASFRGIFPVMKEEQSSDDSSERIPVA